MLIVAILVLSTMISTESAYFVSAAVGGAAVGAAGGGDAAEEEAAPGEELAGGALLVLELAPGLGTLPEFDPQDASNVRHTAKLRMRAIAFLLFFTFLSPFKNQIHVLRSAKCKNE